MSIFNMNKKFCEEKALEILSIDSSFELKEAYNNLATNIIYLPIDDKCKKIAVTSSKYGEGKSSVAINLSVALASNLIDKKVLLVDADMRESHIKSFLSDKINFNGKNSGLSDYLLSSNSDVCIVKSHIENLDVISAGSPAINSAGLLNSDKMSEFISECEKNYDYIIIDTPPVNVVSDAILLIGRINGYILSAKAKHSTVPMVSSASDVLTSVGATVFGVVLTEAKK